MKKTNTDLERFIKISQVDKFKTLSTGIEVRGVANVEQSVSDARRIIAKNSLNLLVKDTAEMAAYKAFEVQIQDAYKAFEIPVSTTIP